MHVDHAVVVLGLHSDMASLLMSRLSKRKLSPPAAHSDGGLPLSARSPDAQRRSPTPTARLRRSEESWSTRWIGGSAAVALLLLLLLLNATFASWHFGALLWSATTNVGRDAAQRFEIGEGAAQGAAGGAAIPGSANENSDAEAELNALCPAPPHCTHPHKTICRPAAQLATAQAEGAAAAHLERLRCANGSAERLAIIVPLRNRTAHARRFRREFSAQLARWEVNATIVFVEQTTAGFFNVRWSPRPLRRPSPALVHCARATTSARLTPPYSPAPRTQRGKLFNVGLHLASGQALRDVAKCHSTVCFHDVDLLPQNGDAAWVSYGGAALSKPVHAIRHASCRKVRGNPSGRYKAGFYGGVLCMRFDDALRINGWSNQFWGWGREDFEIGIRMLRAGLRPQRPCAAQAGAFECYAHGDEVSFLLPLHFTRIMLTI